MIGLARDHSAILGLVVIAATILMFATIPGAAAGSTPGNAAARV